MRSTGKWRHNSRVWVARAGSVDTVKGRFFHSRHLGLAAVGHNFAMNTATTPSRPQWAEATDALREYFDQEWGIPARDEATLFEHLVLENFQVGLSWRIILERREQLRAAFAGFSPDRIAQFTEADTERLLTTDGVIRNRAKIEAVINNARVSVQIREIEFTRGPSPTRGLAGLLWSHRLDEPTAETVTLNEASTAAAKALKKLGYKFVGPTNIFALMEATGIIPNRTRYRV